MGEEEGGYATFMEKQVRQGFIRKVFSILAVQLLVTFSCAIGFASSAPLKAYVSQNMWPVYVAFPATFGAMIGLICCGDLHRRFPHNYCLVGVCTLAYDTQTVLLAVAITGVITVGLVAYAFQTKYDFTTMGGVLISALFGLIAFSFVLMFLPYNKIVNVAFSAVGTFLFSCYLVVDVQMLMEGK